MARPVKYDLNYFPLDVDFFENHKLLLIEEDFGVKGGYLAVRLMAMVYEQGYYLSWKDKSEISCAKRVGNGFTGALVGEILQCCLKHGLFHKGMFEKHRILTSKGIQERWLSVMQNLRRKVEFLQQYSLVSATQTPVSSEETPAPTTFSTQKEKKVNEIKVTTGVRAARAPVPEKKSKSKKNVGKEDLPEPHWSSLVKCWFDFNIKKFQEKNPGADPREGEPSFEGTPNPRILKRIIQRLRKRAEVKKVEWTEENAVTRLHGFLDAAYKEQWLKDHFLLSNLEKQFDAIIANEKKLTNGSQNGTTRQGHTHRAVITGAATGAGTL